MVRLRAQAVLWYSRRHDLQRPLDHMRAMPRPNANIVRACVCSTPRTELAALVRSAARDLGKAWLPGG
jgi:hypothetical protein